MRKLLTAVALLIVAAVAVADAGAKGVATLVVVGSNGRSIRIEPEPAVLAVMLYHPGSIYNHRPQPATPRGGYVKLYPLGAGGFPAIPGRFYPATRALCFGWNQAAAPRPCGRHGLPRRLLAASQRFALFRGRPTTLSSLRPGGTVNLAAALELAFDRYRASRSAPRPARCLPFVAGWDGPQAAWRPSQICIAPRGVYAGGRLYPAGPAVWRLALDVS
jgi:hypothetical protein